MASQFRDDPEGLRKNLEQLLKLQGSPLASTVASAAASLNEVDYDNWNGGVYYFQLELGVPMSVFARVEPNLREVEQQLLAKAASLVPTGDCFLREVRLVPATEQSEEGALVSSDHLWIPSGYFRLFLSHVAAHRVRVAELKKELSLLGVTAFVAHADIEPTQTWPDEIERALRSMQALAALLTPDFHNSAWTDQEVGFALARRVLIIPVRLGLDPYGFLGRVQGTSGHIDYPGTIANGIVDILMKHSQTSATMAESLVAALENSPSYVATNAIVTKLEKRTDLTPPQLARLSSAAVNNGNVRGAYTAPTKIERLCAAHGFIREVRTSDDDEIPF